MSQVVKLRKDYSELRVFPLDRRLLRLLHGALTYTKKSYLATYEERRANGGSPIRLENITCYVLRKYDGKTQLVCLAGYEQRILQVLREHRYTVDQGEGLTPEMRSKLCRTLGRPRAYEVHWDRVQKVIFRAKQRELMELMLGVERGQVQFPTGSGKSFIAQLICLALPRARILITTKYQATLKDLYETLRKRLPNVGIWCSDKKHNSSSARVMLVSAGSLHRYVNFRPDLLIGDEAHELATDYMFEKLAQFRFCRFLGLSANYMDRLDQVDFELEGLFGPKVAELSYEEAVAAGLVVPIEVHWRTARFPANPGAWADGVMLRRLAIWQHTARNRKIASDARKFPDDQVLIVVKTIDHAVHLHQYLPEFQMCYSQMHPKALKRYKAQGLLPRNYRPLTPAERDTMRTDFANGDLKKVIATSVWNRGVNFHRLQVLIRADGGASRIDDTQVPGRLSRLCQTIGKTCGILIDYQDEFDERLEEKAQSRRRAYRRKGWAEIEPANDLLFPRPAPSR